jgi:hypothetical protein
VLHFALEDFAFFMEAEQNLEHENKQGWSRKKVLIFLSESLYLKVTDPN